MSVSDDLMWRYFSLVLCLPDPEIAALQPRRAGRARAIRARSRTSWPGASWRSSMARRRPAKLQRSSREVFSQNQVPTDIPTVRLDPADRPDGRMNIIALLVKAGLAPSNSEARRLVQQGAVRVGDARVSDPKASVDVPDGIVIRCGKRGFARVG